MTFEHGVGFLGVQVLDEAPAVGIEAQAQIPRRRHFWKPAADGEGVGDFAAVVIHQHGDRLAGKGVCEHLGRLQRRSGIADQHVGHGAEAAVAAEEMRRGAGGVADETLGADLGFRRLGAHGGRIGHDFRHFGTGAMARVHGHELDVGQFNAHGEGVVGGDAGGAELLQVKRLQIDQPR